jgi:hypothetical protein
MCRATDLPSRIKPEAIYGKTPSDFFDSEMA